MNPMNTTLGGVPIGVAIPPTLAAYAMPNNNGARSRTA